MWLALLMACGGDAPEVSGPAPEPAAKPAAEPAPEPATEPAPAAPVTTDDDPSGFGLRGVDYACAPCEDLRSAMGVDLKASTSSTLDAKKYAPDNAIDPDLSKAWCEGKKDASGVGETFKLEFGRELGVDGLAIYGGFFKSMDLLKANDRIKKVRVTSDNGIDEVVAFEDPTIAKKVDPSTGAAIDDWFSAVTEGEPPWHTLRTGKDDQNATWLQVEILEVYPGAKYTDTCIARIDVLVVDPEEL